MVKKLVMATVACLVASSCYAKGLVYCNDFDNNLNPKNVASKFEGTQVSWIASSDSEFGAQQLTITVYKNISGHQELLLRENFDVNPKWNAYGVKNFDFGEIGNYEIVINKLDGAEIASGEVSLTEAQAPIAKKPEEKLGLDMKELFNRYAPK